MLNLENIFSYSGSSIYVSYILLLIVGFRLKIFNKKPLNIFYFWVGLFVFISTIEELFIFSVKNHTAFWLPMLNKFQITDTNFFSFYTRIIDIVFIIPFFSNAIKPENEKKWERAYYSLIASSVIIYLFIDGWRNYGTVNSVINRSLLIVLPLAYFWKLYRQVSNLNLWKNSYFLISLGILIPNLLSLVMSFIGDKLAATDYVLFIKVSLFRNFVSLIGQVLFIRAFIYSKYTKFL